MPWGSVQINSLVITHVLRLVRWSDGGSNPDFYPAEVVFSLLNYRPAGALEES